VSGQENADRSMVDGAGRRGPLRGPQDIQEARLRDAVGRLQVLLLRDLVGQYEADERDPDLASDRRGWVSEDILVSRALGIYGPRATMSNTERMLVIGVLEDLRYQGFVDRFEVDSSIPRGWRLRRQNDEIVEMATRFVDDYTWVPPILDVPGVIQAVSSLGGSEPRRELLTPPSGAPLTGD
jgi:hypothetical protein